MKLLGSLTSPFVRKVRVVLAEKHLAHEFAVESPYVAGTPVASANPLVKVPVLLLDDGLAIFDSRLICEHLDSLVATPPLYPAAGRERLLVKRWEVLADGICDAAATIFLERKRPASQQSPEWIARQHDKITGALAQLANDLGASIWCAGAQFSQADVAVGCALGYLAFRFPEIDWAARHPVLGALYERLMARESFHATLPQG